MASKTPIAQFYLSLPTQNLNIIRHDQFKTKHYTLRFAIIV